MALKKINYNGSSKVIIRLCEMVNQLIDGGGGGSTVTYTQTLSSGTKTGEISIDGVSTDMYAPTQPTKVSDLSNDSGFITNTVNNLTNYYLKSETYTQAEVNSLISAIVTLNILVVQTLPTQDISTTTIYLVPKQTPETQDIYDEYIYVNNAWEHIGTTEIDLSNYYTKSQTDSLLADKVDKVSGKQLSTEDFTSALKTKLDGIASGAEVNVQSDWSQSDNTADDFIKNKPTNVSDFNNDSGFITGVDVEDIGDVNLTNLANGQVLKYNSSTQKWENQNESGGGSSYTEGDGIDISAQNVISVDTTFSEASTRTNIASGDTFATILGKIKKFFTDLKTVAFTGAYSDLSGLPTIPSAQVNSDWDASSGVAQILNKPTLATVATSGSYNDLSNKPTIPTDFVSKANGGTFNGNITVDKQDGTTSAVGNSYCILGNSKTSTTDKNSRGRLRIYGLNNRYADFYDKDGLSANRNYYLPNKSGTIALTSDIPSSLPANGGTSENISLPRVAESCNNLPSGGISRMREYTAGANYNLPNNNYYHILESRSPDTNWGTQLALGMTDGAVYYRRYANGSWQSWSKLILMNDIKLDTIAMTFSGGKCDIGFASNVLILSASFVSTDLGTTYGIDISWTRRNGGNDFTQYIFCAMNQNALLSGSYFVDVVYIFI